VLSKDVVPNQVFIGCPWKTVRKKYVDLREEIKKRFPIHFVIVGSEVGHSAEDLLNYIKSRLETSSSAIFDVSGGNPNVSLEFGYAEGLNIESALYISTHGKSGRSSSSIISDLAGKRRKEYKNENSLTRLVSEFCKNHPYTIKFEKAMKVLMKRLSKGEKKSYRALSLKIIHYFDDKEIVRRDDLLHAVTATQETAKKDRRSNYCNYKQQRIPLDDVSFFSNDRRPLFRDSRAVQSRCR
jgi:uncharacterized protein YjaZ